MVGGGHSGKDDVTHLLARLTFPTGGRIVVAGANFADVHQAVPGRRIAYATQNAYIFSGTLAHNLYYGLKHQPLRPATYDEAQAKRERTRVRDALAAGNSPDDVRADWIDYEAAGVADAGRADRSRARRSCGCVEMEQEVIGFGLASTVDPQADPAFAAMGLEARARIRDRVQREDLASFVELFDRDCAITRTSASPRTCCSARRGARRSSRPTCPAIPSSSHCCATSDCWTTSTPSG